MILPSDRTAIAGASAGGELVLALGLRHPDVLGAVYCASPGGGFRPPESLPDALPRFYFTAVTGESFFLENARRWADALHAAGTDGTTRGARRRVLAGGVRGHGAVDLWPKLS